MKLTFPTLTDLTDLHSTHYHPSYSDKSQIFTVYERSQNDRNEMICGWKQHVIRGPGWILESGSSSEKLETRNGGQCDARLAGFHLLYHIVHTIVNMMQRGDNVQSETSTP